MTISKKQQACVNRYIAGKYDRINLTVKKGIKQALQEAAKDKGESINGYIKNAVKAKYKADTGMEIDL